MDRQFLYACLKWGSQTDFGGNSKNIWGVNAKNQIFTWTGNGWRQIAGELKYVSAGSDGTSGV